MSPRQALREEGSKANDLLRIPPVVSLLRRRVEQTPALPRAVAVPAYEFVNCSVLDGLNPMTPHGDMWE